MDWSSRQTLSWNAVPFGLIGTENSDRWPLKNCESSSAAVVSMAGSEPGSAAQHFVSPLPIEFYQVVSLTDELQVPERAFYR